MVIHRVSIINIVLIESSMNSGDNGMEVESGVNR